MNSDFSQIAKRKCIQKENPNPSTIPKSILGDDCFLGFNDIESFCENYGNLIDWLFRDCKTIKSKIRLEKRCERVRSWIPNTLLTTGTENYMEY